MERAPKVSVIIPNYNREHLIIDTLESIKIQTYVDFECIIVDDHSSDNSWKVVQAWITTDSRFKLFKRPQTRKKGANACRNYGFELSSGRYIQWFDSDDLMTPDHLEKLVSAIAHHKVDFAIGDSQNFSEENPNLGKPYNFDRNAFAITATNFGKQAIGWITDDFLGKKEIFGTVRFNEDFKTDGDEYNFFTQMLHENDNGIFVNEILTLRRMHKNTLSSAHVNDEFEYLRKVATIKLRTCLDIEKYGNTELIKWYLSGYMQYSFNYATKTRRVPYFKAGVISIRRYFGVQKVVLYMVAIITALIWGKGYLFLRKAIQF